MRFLAALFVSLFLFCASPSQAEDMLNMHSFKNFPVQHEGRLKPLDSFAQITLKQISGQEKIGKFSAVNWLALTLFDPQNAARLPVFKIRSAALREKLDLPSDKNLLSFSALQPALDKTRSDVETIVQKDPATFTDNERDLLQLHENAATLTTLMRSFTALLPLDVTLLDKYKAQMEGELTFTQLAKIEQQLQQDLKTIIAKKGPTPTDYSPQELSIAKATFHIQALRAGGANNTLLRIIPSSWAANKNGAQDNEWFAPWAILLRGEGSPSSAFLISQWTELASAYRTQNHDLWLQTSADLLDETHAQSNGEASAKRFSIERTYRNSKPYIAVLGLYILSLAAAALIILKPARINAKAPIILAAAGLTLHIAALSARTYILERPPVGTLYESLLFVALICALIALITTLVRKTPAPLIAGLIASITLLLIAPVFAPAADSLEVLVAVLNTNFWLAIHVLCITAGYGVCILCASLAHGALYIRGFRNSGKNGKEGDALWTKLQQSIHHISLAALFLTTLGTVLGGIWADQSWGRFWGWDPKENGALLIVLWLIWAQHGRIGKKLTPPSYIAMMAALNIIVAISWFGVNLLNVGLHSYGFTNGMAAALIAFCAIETAIITALYIAAKKQDKK